MNRSSVERAERECMLFEALLSTEIWAEALATAAYIINRSPMKSINGKTPIEMWTNKKPNLSNIKIFGFEVMVQISKKSNVKNGIQNQRN